METARQLARFYQQMSDKPFLVMLYRIQDVWDSKRTLSVIFEVKGLELRMRYQMYSSWTNKGLPHSISNLRNRNRLPEPKPLFITEDIEDRLLELEGEDKIDFINHYFANVLDILKTVLKSERLSHTDLGWH